MRRLYIQCLSCSLAVTRSIVLFTPNGLPQRMQQNGCSSLRTRADAVAARKSSCGFERDHLLRAGRLAQPALHAGILGEPQQGALRIVGERTGRARRHAGKAQRAARDVELDRAEGRALGQRQHVDRLRCGAVQLAQGEAQHAALGALRQEACGLLRRLAWARWPAAPRPALRDRRSRSWPRGRRRSRARRGSAPPARSSAPGPSRRGAASPAGEAAAPRRRRQRPPRWPRGRPA